MERSISVRDSFGVSSDWIDPMEEEASDIQRERISPYNESVHSNSTKVDEAEAVTCTEVHPSKLNAKSPIKEFAQELARPPSRSLKETPPKLSHDLEKTCTYLNAQQKIIVFSTPKMKLEEICTSNHWNHPYYILCREEVHGDNMMFTYKVIVDVDGISFTALECFGNPRTERLAAQEHAAEGALWYLMHLGYPSTL